MSSSPASILLNSLSSPILLCLALISAFRAWTSRSFRMSGRDLTALSPEACARARADDADFMGDLSGDIELPFFNADGKGGTVGSGFGTLKLAWKRTLLWVEADPKGSVAANADTFFVGIAGNGLGPSGLMVACIRARDEAVGAYSRELGTAAVTFGRIRSDAGGAGGGGGAGLAFFSISA